MNDIEFLCFLFSFSTKKSFILISTQVNSSASFSATRRDARVESCRIDLLLSQPIYRSYGSCSWYLCWTNGSKQISGIPLIQTDFKANWILEGVCMYFDSKILKHLLNNIWFPTNIALLNQTEIVQATIIIIKNVVHTLKRTYWRISNIYCLM